MEVHEDGNLRVTKLANLGPYSNNAYVIADTSANEAIIVDMPHGSQATLDALRDLNVNAIVLTHTHPDHWDDYDLVKNATGAPVRAHGAEYVMPREKVDEPIADEEEITVGGAKVKALFTPGHTPGSTCFVAGKYLFSGDVLFPGGPGRTNSPEDLQQSIESIKTRLYPLPDETLVLPGHGDDTTIGASKKEFAVFESKSHPAGLCGDVTWEGS